MVKNSLLIAPLLLVLVACKKEKTTTAPNLLTGANISGTWSLSSYQTNFGIGVNASVSQYPCMMYNTLTFYNDSTASQFYSGIDTCFVTPTHSLTNGAQDFGLPGLNAQAATWSLKGNVMLVTYPGQTSQIYGTISSVNNQLQLTLRDTSVTNGKTYYIASVLVKQ